MALRYRCDRVGTITHVRTFSSRSGLRNSGEKTEQGVAATEGADSTEGNDALTEGEPAPARDGELSKNANSHSHRKAFVRWVSGPGKRYIDATREPGTTNYLDGKSHPFPLNPMFRPQPPVSETVKASVIQDWQNGTGLRQISTKYGVTLERVEAILKLKQVRDRWTEEVSHYPTTTSTQAGPALSLARSYMMPNLTISL